MYQHRWEAGTPLEKQWEENEHVSSKGDDWQLKYILFKVGISDKELSYKHFGPNQDVLCLFIFMLCGP